MENLLKKFTGLIMWPIKQIGYLPGYSGDSKYNFTRLFNQRIAVCFDTVDIDDQYDFVVLCQCEPPKLYIRFESMVRQSADKFNLILAYDERLLALPNSQEFIPVGSWVDDIELNKADQISYLMSSKIWTGEHRMRFQILRLLENTKKINQFDFFMHRSPPRIANKNDFFTNAKFHIACENQVMNNMFSEKLIDCFRTRTVPIYYGCTNLGKYFNTKGVLAFNTIEEFEHIVNTLTPDVYDSLQPYIEENYHKARPYWEQSIYQRIEQEVANKLCEQI